MRIGIEAQRIFRKKKHGMDIVSLELIKALQQIDLTNEYFIFVKKGEDTCLQASRNFHIIEVPGFTYADWEQVFLPLYALRYRLDVLHCTSNTAPVLSPVPTIVTLHDVIFLEQQQAKSLVKNRYQQLGRIYRKYIVPASLKHTEHIITVSQYEKERISETLRLQQDEISVVYNAYGSHFLKPDSNKIEVVREKYQLPASYLFYIGNTDPKKNMPATLQAYANYVANSHHSLPLVIADVSEPVLLGMLESTGLMHLRPQITLTGYVYNTDLPMIYAGAAVFLYPSLRESFGIPLLESMACGTPVITSSTSALPEVAGNAALLVNPTDQNAITSAINSLLNNYNTRTEYIQKGLERVKSFSWHISANHLLSIYQRFQA